MPKRKRGRRVKYSPEEVVLTILHKPLFFAISVLLFTSGSPLHATEISRILERKLKTKVNPGYIYNILKKFEKWGVAEPVRDPVNGRLAFKPSDKKVAKLLGQEIEKRVRKEVEDVLHNTVI